MPRWIVLLVLVLGTGCTEATGSAAPVPAPTATVRAPAASTRARARHIQPCGATLLRSRVWSVGRGDRRGDRRARCLCDGRHRTPPRVPLPRVDAEGPRLQREAADVDGGARPSWTDVPVPHRRRDRCSRTRRGDPGRPLADRRRRPNAHHERPRAHLEPLGCHRDPPRGRSGRRRHRRVRSRLVGAGVAARHLTRVRASPDRLALGSEFRARGRRGRGVPGRARRRGRRGRRRLRNGRRSGRRGATRLRPIAPPRRAAGPPESRVGQPLCGADHEAPRRRRRRPRIHGLGGPRDPDLGRPAGRGRVGPRRERTVGSGPHLGRRTRDPPARGTAPALVPGVLALAAGRRRRHAVRTAGRPARSVRRPAPCSYGRRRRSRAMSRPPTGGWRPSRC